MLRSMSGFSARLYGLVDIAHHVNKSIVQPTRRDSKTAFADVRGKQYPPGLVGIARRFNHSMLKPRVVTVK
jgi:hypothetical protein